MDPRHSRTASRTPAPAESPKAEISQRLRLYQLMFSLPFAAEELIHEFIPEDRADQLDMSTLRPFPPEEAAGKLNVRPSDCVWRVSFKEGGSSMVFVFLFQDTVDPDMALRTMQYVTDVWLLLHEHPELRDANGAVPDVQTCVVNIGEQPWDAPTTMQDWARAQLPSDDPESHAPPKLPSKHAVVYQPRDDATSENAV